MIDSACSSSLIDLSGEPLILGNTDISVKLDVSSDSLIDSKYSVAASGLSLPNTDKRLS